MLKFVAISVLLAATALVGEPQAGRHEQNSTIFSFVERR